MTDLQVFKNEEFGQVRTVEVVGGTKYLVIGNEKINKFELLALASKISDEDEKTAWEVLKLASMLYHPEDDFAFNELYGTVAMDIARKSIERECDIYLRFDKKIKKLFGPNARVIKKKSDPRHIPDRWVSIEGNIMPVEIKLHKFDKRALSQLKRYMDFYNCAHGIAVAKSLDVKLPENIRFISTDELKE